MRAWSILPICLALSIAGCGDDDTGGEPDAAGPPSDAGTPTPDADDPTTEELPRLVDAPCRYPIDPSQTVGESVHCADLFVASRRDGSPATPFRLHVVRFGPRTPRPDPLVFLTGGPGQDLLLTDVPRELSDALAAERDFVQITQRGVGEVEPTLDCPALSELPLFQGDQPEEYYEIEAAGVLGCRDSFIAAGIDLAAFSSRELAADVEDLRVTLGVSQVVLYGASYGSLWALEVMRRHPTSVRATLIDSIAAPSLFWTLQSPRALQTALERLFAYCADSPACATTYGEGYPLLRDAFATLEEEPITLPESGLVLRGVDLGQLVFTAMYNNQLFGIVPLLLSRAADRDAEGLEALLEPLAENLASLVEGTSSLQPFAIWCSDSAQYYDASDIDAAHDGVWPEISATFRTGDDRLDALCADWPLAPAEPLAPVVSDVPTLVGNGEMDPVTPDTSAEQVVETLSNGRFVRAPRLGHAGIGDTCGIGVLFELVSGLDPDAIDLSCVDDAPEIEFLTATPEARRIVPARLDGRHDWLRRTQRPAR